MKRYLFTFCILALFSTGIHAQESTAQKILFVGNSYTYFWNLPQNVALMSADQHLPVITHQSTAGGASWEHHWKGQRSLETIKIIEEGDFDLVILQNHSMGVFEELDSMIHYGELLNDLIRKSGAQTMLYMTWAREHRPSMIDTIHEGYMKLANKLNAPIAPVGLAWKRAKELRPEIALYDQDQSHPSPLGTYLTSCVFFATIHKKTPVGITHRLIMKDENGEKLYINIQSQEDALFCQQVAEEVVNKFID